MCHKYPHTVAHSASQAKVSSLEPTLISYNSMIKSCSQAGSWQDASQLLHLMMTGGPGGPGRPGGSSWRIQLWHNDSSNVHHIFLLFSIIYLINIYISYIYIYIIFIISASRCQSQSSLFNESNFFG